MGAVESNIRPTAVTLGLRTEALPAGHYVEILTAATEDDVDTLVASHAPAVVVLGPLVGPAEALRIVLRITAENGGPRCIVSGVGPAYGRFQGCVDTDSIFYLSQGELPSAELELLVAAAAGVHVLRERMSLWEPAAAPEALLDFVTRITGQVDPLLAGDVLAGTVRQVVGADAVRYFVHDRRTHTLQSSGGAPTERRFDSAAAGILGYVACSGQPAVVHRIRRDPRYDAELDDLLGDDDAVLVAEPVTDQAGAAVGVLAIARRAGRAPFSAVNLQAIRQLAFCAGPALTALALRDTLRMRVMEEAIGAPDHRQIYREEALVHLLDNHSEAGQLIATFGPFMQKAAVGLALMCAVTAATLAVAEVPDYATGRAVVRDHGSSGDELIALVPASYRPRLAPGMNMRVRLDPDGELGESVPIEAVGPVLSNSAAIASYVGGGVDVTAPAVVVRSHLPPSYRAYEAEGVGRRAGRVDIKVGSESVLVTLVPALKRLRGE